MNALQAADWLMFIAIVLAPLIAVQVSQWLDRARDKRNRQVEVFRTLMTTRRSRMAPDHIKALNMLDVEFSGNDRKEREVVDAWKAYLDHLNDSSMSAEVWGTRGDDLFVDLIYAVANAVGYEFDKTHLRRSAYYPRGYGEAEWDVQQIRSGFREVLEGKRSIPVWVDGSGLENPVQSPLAGPQSLSRSIEEEDEESAAGRLSAPPSDGDNGSGGPHGA